MHRKYPRTMNLPYSESNSSDDVWWCSTEPFEGKEVVATSKMDGECTTMYYDICHARSIDSMHSHHPSRSYVKALHASIRHKIPKGMRVIGENLYAKHAIEYRALPGYFLVFAIVVNNDWYLSWDETEYYARELGLPTVPKIYQGVWDEVVVRQLWPHSIYGEAEAEGYVVRTRGGFEEKDFATNVAKYVRKNHVQAGTPHWMSQRVIPNGLQASLFNF